MYIEIFAVQVHLHGTVDLTHEPHVLKIDAGGRGGRFVIGNYYTYRHDNDPQVLLTYKVAREKPKISVSGKGL